MENKISFSGNGSFLTGVNYWASHAATDMWKDWREDVIEKDLALLAAHGTQVLRVFPIWPDFQPLHALYQGDGTLQEYRFGEAELPDTPAGHAGVSEVMMMRFERFADIAERHSLSLIVALITGQMTARLFMPPAFSNRNPIDDPEVLVWEERFVKYFVSRMNRHTAIAAWNFGNECNFMGKAASPAAASHWMASMANAIRVSDRTRPIISGMNGNALVEKMGGSPGYDYWPVVRQAEHCDVLTAHHYHMWTSAVSDPVNTIKAVLSPVAENKIFADVSGKPCFVEEIGLWRPAHADFETLSAYLRGIYWNLFANDGGGLLWWCAFDQDNQKIPPYDWDMAGLEHGLFTHGHEVRTTALEMRSFRRTLDDLPFSALPSAKPDAVCLVGNERQNLMTIATASFILSQQAGITVTVQQGRQPLKEAALYLIPSAVAKTGLSAGNWEILRKRVQEGAALYMSMDDVYVDHMSEVFGVDVCNRYTEPQNGPYSFDLGGEKIALSFPVKTIFEMQPHGAQVLGRDGAGRPALFSATYGKGKVYLLNFPIEKLMMETPSAFLKDASHDAWKLYRFIAVDVLKRHVTSKSDPLLTLIERPISDTELAAVAVNNSPKAMQASVTLDRSWQFVRCYPTNGDASCKDGVLTLPLRPNDGTVIHLKRKC